MATEFSSEDRTYLRRFLEQKFSLDELKTLSFDLGVDYEDFPHDTRPEFARELIRYYERVNRLHALIKAIIQERADPQLVQIMARVPETDGIQKVQLILSNDQLRSKPDLQQKLAELLGISANEVMLIATAAGSLKVLVGLPPEAVARLQALPLPYQLGEYEIIAVQPFVTLSKSARDGWRSAFETAVRSSAGAVARGGLAALLGKILLWFLGGTALVLLLVGGGTAIWYRGLPQMTLVNNCSRTLPVPLPDLGRSLLGLPPEIPQGGEASFPIVTGAGEYRLEVEKRAGRDLIVLRTPRPVPLLNSDKIDLGPIDEDVRFRLNGQMVSIPGRFLAKRGEANELILCAGSR